MTDHLDELGEALDANARRQLLKRVKTATRDEYVAGLQVQLGKGGSDDAIQELIAMESKDQPANKEVRREPDNSEEARPDTKRPK